MTVPAFNMNGLLPPYVGKWPDSGVVGVAPYGTTISDFCQQFGWSAVRRDILRGFLDLRKALRAEGLLNGFQWINGSFCEDIEKIEARDPGDIDVATFCVFPANLKNATAFPAWAANNQSIVNSQVAKQTFKTDHYLIDLSNNAALVIKQTCYWHSVFSHRRNDAWKGYVFVGPESQATDDAARAQLATPGIVP